MMEPERHSTSVAPNRRFRSCHLWERRLPSSCYLGWVTDLRKNPAPGRVFLSAAQFLPSHAVRTSDHPPAQDYAAIADLMPSPHMLCLLYESASTEHGKNRHEVTKALVAGIGTPADSCERRCNREKTRAFADPASGAHAKLPDPTGDLLASKRYPWLAASSAVTLTQWGHRLDRLQDSLQCWASFAFRGLRPAWPS